VNISSLKKKSIKKNMRKRKIEKRSNRRRDLRDMGINLRRQQKIYHRKSKTKDRRRAMKRRAVNRRVRLRNLPVVSRISMI